MGPTSFTGIVYETSIEMGYFLLALTLVVSCGTRRPGTTRDRQQPPIQASLLIPLTHLGRPIPPIHRIPVPLVNPTTTVLQASAVKTAPASRAT